MKLGEKKEEKFKQTEWNTVEKRKKRIRKQKMDNAKKKEIKKEN